MERTDRDLKHDVLRELAWDTQVSETGIGVIVRRGIVTLLGTVGSYAGKLAAQEAAHRVPGVRAVANEIEVHVPPDRMHSDAEIAAAVQRAIEWDAMVPHESIRATVSGGFVTLSGSVRFLREKHDAEDMVRRLEGVRGVIDEIEVVGPGAEAAEIRREIEDALARRAHREAAGLHVEVDHGIVTVSGSVDSWADKRAVLGLAGHAPGVHDVKDAVAIAPGVGRGALRGGATDSRK